MSYRRKNTIRAALLTLLITASVVAFLVWWHFRTPIPPYPEGGGGPGMGLEVNLGFDDEGSGQNNPEDVVNMPDFVAAKAPDEGQDKILTSNDDESESIKDTEQKNIPNKANVTKEKPAKEKPREKAAPQHKQVINEKLMFKKKTASDGNTAGDGDKGNPNGTAASAGYTGNGDGSNGGGTNTGNGNSEGAGTGGGIAFTLDGRTPQYLEKPEYTSQAEGKVVVEITVDKNGKVMSAVPGAKGSTTLDEYLLMVAKKAALQSTFSKNLKATIQKGTITYRFVLQ